jgi:CcmD family protein
MENLSYLVAAYAVVWIGLALYLTWLGARLASLRRDIAALRDLVEPNEPPDEPSDAIARPLP